MTLSLPRSPSPVDWTIMNQWWCGWLPPPPSCLTPLTCRTTHPCRLTTQRYTYPVPLEVPTVQNSTNHDVQSAAHSARNPADPPINVSATKKSRPPNSSTSLLEMRSSTTWGQYIRTQGGQLLDPAYPASSGRTKARKSQTKKAVMKTTTTTRIPTQYQPWDVQLQRMQMLIGDRQRLT